MNVPRPALRYHGGKWNLAPWIISNFPPHRVYVEPFGGAASVLLRKPQSYAEIYNDLDGEIVNVFRVLREHPTEICRLLELTPFARAEFFRAYEKIDDPVEAARRTMVKSFMGFGSDSIRRKSGFRANSNRSGTTPAHDWKNYADMLPHLIARLRSVVIEQRDGFELIAIHDREDTLFYVDPPYVHATRTSNNRYSHEMTDREHRELASCLHAVRGKVLLSGYASELYEELYGDWFCIRKSALADGARDRTENLWANYKMNIAMAI
jgi:DNA adenine methylase